MHYKFLRKSKGILILLMSLQIYYILKKKKEKKLPKVIIKKKKKFSKFEDLLRNQKKLYNASEIKYISIIINCENSKFNYGNISNLISSLLNQTFKDIQIIVLLNSSFIKKKDIILNFHRINKNIKICILDNEFWLQRIFEIINEIKTKYIIILENFIELKNDDLFNIYNMIKGNINNILKYPIKNGYIYLMRAKIIRDIFDSKIQFNNYKELINFFFSYPLPKINYIPISYCPNNLYTALVYTSMLSVLNSKEYYSYIIFYIVISKDFKEQNKCFLESLYEQYDYFNITFIRMDDRYKNAFTASYLTIQAYYRYSLGELIPNLNKIIYLDADTICLTDLSNLYNLNFRGKVILGRILSSGKGNQNKYLFINTGVLLLDLLEMRKMKFEKKMLNILNNGFGRTNIPVRKIINMGTDLNTQDQALINIYFNKYLGPLPPKYNAKILDYKGSILFNKNSGNFYDDDYLYFSYKFPAIKHYAGPKKNIFYIDLWNYFARKSKYFNMITNNFSNIYNFSFIC